MRVILSGLWSAIGFVFSLVIVAMWALLSPLSLFTLGTLFLIYTVSPWGFLGWFGIGLVTAHCTYNLPKEARPLNRRMTVGHYALGTFVGLYGPIALAIGSLPKHWPDKWVLGHDAAGEDAHARYEWDGWRWKEVKKVEVR